MTMIVKRLFSILLALSMVFGFVVTANAAETEAEAVMESVTVSDVDKAVTIDMDSFDLSFDMSMLWTDGDVEINEEDPAIITMSQELSDIKVLNADGVPTPLTQEQIQQVLYLYQQYLDHWKANADVLGVQTPFFLSYNDKGEDGLGILGEMLVLAGISVDVVRAGYMSFDDITGMIQNFLYGDALGVQLYGPAVKAARQEVMDLIAKSGAVTDVQKYLVINDWLSHNTDFDMAYIMNTDNAGAMAAEQPVKHEYYDLVYNVIYGDYEKQIQATFRTQISDGLKAAMAVEFYNAAIKQGYADGALANGATEEQANAAAEQFVAENAAAIAADPNAFCVSAFGQEAAAAIAAQWDATWTDWATNGIPGMVGQIKLTAYQAAIQSALVQGGQAEADVAAFLEQNAVYIAADPYAFCAQAFGQAVADQMEAGINEQLKLMGIDPSVETNPQGAVSLELIIAMQMDTPQQDPMLQKADGSYMTPNEAVPVFAGQAAAGLAEGVLMYWQGHHFGALGRGSAVCLGYTKAFTYLVQYLHPEIYGVNGAQTDMSKAENWKTAAELYYNENGELDITKGYIVDSVRISFDSTVTMFGERKDNFNSDHFWNAVLVDGNWYYIDPCYTDVYNTVMMRDRVETDGYINHMYFMFSHTSCESMYDGHYSEIKTLYADVATDKSYEDAWVSRIKSNTYFDGTYAYYFYDSTDLIGLVEAFKNLNLAEFGLGNDSYKIVRHKLTDSDKDDGDSNYEILIDFTFENEDSKTVTVVYDPATGNMVENALLTKLYAQLQEEKGHYPSLSITMALYNGKIYFNVSNCILSYDLTTGAVDLVKEYNVIHGKRDKTNPFGGMAFSVVDSADQADFTVYNRPIAGMTIKNDGKMYVSVATNFSFISGKRDITDTSSYGYEFEESNYNANYSTYGVVEYEGLLEIFGYTAETNDNDEFMWSTNFVETLSMADLTESGEHKHNYQEVSVEATCNRNAFKENRCTACGVSQPGTRVEAEGTARDHHYIYFEEQFYTKNKKDGTWNTGFCYVCTECNMAITKPADFEEDSLASILGMLFEDQKAQHAKEEAAYNHAVAIAGHTYNPIDAVWAEDGTSVVFSALECTAGCIERQHYLDCLVNDNTISYELEKEITAQAYISDGYGNCAEGATAIYTASGEVEGGRYSISKEVILKPGVHPYVNGICAACGEVGITRIAGSNRYNTALLTAHVLKTQMGVEKFENIIVACGNDYADALSGSYLASKKGAPILLINKNNLTTMDSVVTYIAKNLKEGGMVYILGGTSAVPADLEGALEAVNVTSKRLAGNNRYETNLLILQEVGVDDDEAILICTGNDYADALSASATGKPILLVNNRLGKLRDDQKAFLENLYANELYIIGGTGAVSENIAEEVEGYGKYTRLAGSGRYETSVLIAKAFFEKPTYAVLAYGHNFPDGLSGGPLAYYLDAPVILTRDKTKDFAVAYAKEAGLTKGYVLGGDTLIGDETVKEFFQMG